MSKRIDIGLAARVAEKLNVKMSDILMEFTELEEYDNKVLNEKVTKFAKEHFDGDEKKAVEYILNKYFIEGER